MKNFIDSCLNKKPQYSVDDILAFIKQYDNYYIYSAGGAGIFLRQTLAKLGKQVVAFLDSNPLKRDSVHDGLPVYYHEDFNFVGKKILVASDWSVEIKRLLAETYGLMEFIDFIPEVNPWMLDPVTPSPTQYESLLGNRLAYEAVFDLLNDDDSKAIYKKVIYYRLYNLQPSIFDWTMLPTTPQQYATRCSDVPFYLNQIPSAIDQRTRSIAARNLSLRPYSYQDLVVPQCKRVIIDAGAYTGDTAIMFAVLEPTATVLAFEPDVKYCRQINKLSTVYPGIQGIPVGLSDSSKEILINPCDYKDEKPARAVDLDSFVSENNLETVDLIKMDVEGEELAAMMGARQTIERFQPDLAICIYHHPEHLWKIPLLIKKWVPDYELYIDHKYLCVGETVCFARLKNRKKMSDS